MAWILFFFVNDTATTEIYTVRNTLSLHDALPISWRARASTDLEWRSSPASARSRSEEHTSELQSLRTISYAVFCLKKKKINLKNINFLLYHIPINITKREKDN